MSSRFNQLTLLCVLVIIFISKTNTETLQQRLLKDIQPCKADQFRCSNFQCIDSHQLCDGSKNCRDGSDEELCNDYSSKCRDSRSFSCQRGSYYKCLPSSFVCNGKNDCSDKSDEWNCRDKIKSYISASHVHRGKTLAQNWISKLRRTGQPIRKWGADVRRVAVALHLSDDPTFNSANTIRDELGNELSVNLLSRMVWKRIEDISSTELASYINAFLVTCINPRNFFDLDLVKELRRRVDLQNHTLPYVILALCNAGERMSERDVEKLTNFFWTAHRKFWTDMQALSILALSCAARQPDGNIDLAELAELTVKLKASQYSNGTYETLKTTALVMQALIATKSDTDEGNFDVIQTLRQILLAQREDGSFGSVIDTYSIMPVLDYKSLADINSSHCSNISIEEEEVIHDLENQIGVKWSIQLSVWIGNNRTVERTLTLRVPANISFERLMELEEKLGRFRFVFSMRDGKPYIYSIYGMQNDAEEGMYWFLFLRSKGNEEHLEQISPADLIPENNQHLIFWYKCGSWNE
ncbi:unnamed protein product [Larinioides sclopetarius]|uniref:Uncharacterized protein n=2 Tax=Larinioides sclopetarius TaxID=280406 RepID=A0AAV2BU71_9ARAC